MVCFFLELITWVALPSPWLLLLGTRERSASSCCLDFIEGGFCLRGILATHSSRLLEEEIGCSIGFVVFLEIIECAAIGTAAGRLFSLFLSFFSPPRRLCLDFFSDEIGGVHIFLQLVDGGVGGVFLNFFGELIKCIAIGSAAGSSLGLSLVLSSVHFSVSWGRIGGVLVFLGGRQRRRWECGGGSEVA